MVRVRAVVYTRYGAPEVLRVVEVPQPQPRRGDFLRDLARVRPGQRVLVIGAAGSIGAYAVQLAKHLGAHVTGVCGRRNVGLVESLGADRVIDYEIEDFAAGSARYDVVFDAVGRSTFRGRGAC